MTGIDFHHNFNLFFDGLELPRQNKDRTEHMALHSQRGEGFVRRFVPRFDIDVVVSDFTFRQDCSLPLVTKTAMVELNYCLHGRREITVEGAQYEFVPGSCTLQLMNEVGANFEFIGNEPYLMLGIGIPVSTFHHFMEEGGGGRSTDFTRILGQSPFRVFQETLHPAALIILQRMLGSLQNRSTRNLEIECSVLELLSMAFQSFLTDGSSGMTKLSKSDMQKIREARDIIIERMIDPPTLIELSRLIGMNDFKLKTGFKEMYGTTVFGYLRDKRLEKALLLLQQGNMNVNETSCAVGYSNSSYFSEVFREKYGINPGKLVKQFATSALLTSEQ
ncbi:AraC-type DNA-binding protein [Paenibacillus uliginis N3/975]|uniref:AraC-type DNA-binding protein n=1 Tax=Paenibacillus uliginis N3/975 TaxID=1313296 RepID=A0A1X7HFF3_9BACL|nr:AraC family transcriptional regulator [Paenibacillus uliginis]SMF84602.1 AraC-type DNA-binding protein [Paenibacillus uliginis N3/975]